MEAWLEQLQQWHWWIGAVVFLILEVTTPAFFFLWLGIAAAMTGMLLLFFPDMGWKSQCMWFSGLALVSIAFWRFFMRRHPTVSELPVLNRRSSQYVGRVVVVSEAIVNGMGKVRVDDSTWKVQGPDCPAGANVRVVAALDAVLQVELVN
ncbi:MAG: NfeD family protein [Magnetococcales bacterium]|nr:NfeD family protein [Magnetococcales bacterium]NGZ26424.1 NfeD family protein [Magnetococcales bacterium]